MYSNWHDMMRKQLSCSSQNAERLAIYTITKERALHA